jgi:hypothetical protein
LRRAGQRFDAKGFLARYLFKPKEEDPYANIPVPTKSSKLASASTASFSQPMFCMLIVSFTARLQFSKYLADAFLE